MIRKISYFGGNTYFEDVLPFLKKSFPKYEFVPADKNCSGTLLAVPTIDSALEDFLNKLSSPCRVIGFLDHNHFGFGDYRVFQRFIPDCILTPRIFESTTRIKIIPSLHAEMMKDRVQISKSVNDRDFLFCSQPLWEDRGIDQHEFLEKAMVMSRAEGVNVYLRRHPRERRELPHYLKQDPGLIEFHGSIEEALANFSRWIGLNSIALYDAEALGHQVEFLDFK